MEELQHDGLTGHPANGFLDIGLRKEKRHQSSIQRQQKKEKRTMRLKEKQKYLQRRARELLEELPVMKQNNGGLEAFPLGG
jgi:hypothetical protein